MRSHLLRTGLLLALGFVGSVVACGSDDGKKKPQGPRFEFVGGALTQDEHGNTRGGIRYPVVDVPIARYASTLCPLGGITMPFSDAQIAALYPTHADYYCRMQAASEQAVAAGFLLPEDMDELMARVEGAANRFAVAGERECE